MSVCPEGRALSTQLDHRGRAGPAVGGEAVLAVPDRALWPGLAPALPGVDGFQPEPLPRDPSGGGCGASAVLHPLAEDLEAQRGQNLPAAAQ